MESKPQRMCTTSDWVRVTDGCRIEVSFTGQIVETCPHSTFFRRAVFEGVGFSPQLTLDVLLQLLSNVLLKAQASALEFNFESSLTLLQTLTELLFESGPDASSQLVLPIGEHGFVAFFQAGDFVLFHLLEPLFHLFLEACSMSLRRC